MESPGAELLQEAFRDDHTNPSDLMGVVRVRGREHLAMEFVVHHIEEVDALAAGVGLLKDDGVILKRPIFHKHGVANLQKFIGAHKSIAVPGQALKFAQERDPGGSCVIGIKVLPPRGRGLYCGLTGG